MSQDNKQALAAGDFDPARDIMFKLQDFWFKYKNIVTVVVVLVIVGLAWFGYDKKTKAENLEVASNAFSSAMNVAKTDTIKGIEMLTAVYDEHQETPYARYSAYGIGGLYLAKGDAAKAIEWYDQALAKKSADIIITPEATEGKAVAFELQDNVEGAKTLYKEVIAMGSHRTKDVSLKLAYLEMKSGNSSEAEKYCKNIVADTANITATTYNAEALLAEINATKK